jgi:hypothetical protein
LAEIKRIDGDATAAADLLKQAHQLNSDDPLTKEMLAEVLLERLAADFETFQKDIPLVREVLQGREQEIELLRIEAVGLESIGQRLPAFDAYEQLVDSTASGPIELRIGPDYFVRSDRWIRGRLGRLWLAASGDEQSAIRRKLENRRPTGAKVSSGARLRRYLDHFAELPGADDVRLQLTRWLVERQHTREAEIELLRAASSPAKNARDTAQALADEVHLLGDAAENETWLPGRIEVKTSAIAGIHRNRANNRPQPDRQPGLRRLNIEQNTWSSQVAPQWFITPGGTELVCRDGLGNDMAHVVIEGTGAARAAGDHGAFHAARLGNLLFVSLGNQILGIDSRQGEQGSGGELMWQAYPTVRLPLVASTTRRSQATSRANVFDVWSGRRRIAGSFAGGLGPATPDGVVYQIDDELQCVDPLSGETLWKRSGIPSGCELFGDHEVVLAADVAQRVAYLFRIVDGEPLERRSLPEFPWMLTAGRNIAQRGVRGLGNARKMFLRITDATSDRVIFEDEYDDQAKMSVVEPQAVAVFEPSGRFQLVDVRTGDLRIDQQLEAVSEPQSIQTLLAGDELFLMINTRSLVQQHRPIAPVDFPMINGQVYAFSLASGEPLWPGPALVRNRSIALGQPQDLPVLVFVDRKATRDSNTGGGSQIRILVLDKRTGQTVYRNEGLPDTAASRFRIRAERENPATIKVEMSAAEVLLTMTDAPRPPQPPANDELEAPRSGSERGLWGVAGRMSDAFQNALESQRGRSQRRAANGQDIAVEPMDDD